MHARHTQGRVDSGAVTSKVLVNSGCSAVVNTTSTNVMKKFLAGVHGNECTGNGFRCCVDLGQLCSIDRKKTAEKFPAIRRGALATKKSTAFSWPWIASQELAMTWRGPRVNRLRWLSGLSTSLRGALATTQSSSFSLPWIASQELAMTWRGPRVNRVRWLPGLSTSLRGALATTQSSSFSLPWIASQELAMTWRGPRVNRVR
jgi:hypothetical protein